MIVGIFYATLCTLLWPPSVTSCDGRLPVVDLTSSDAAISLVEAFQTWGLSYIKGHNVPENVVKEAEVNAKRFFKMPSRVKRQLRADRSRSLKTARGFTGLRGEKLDVSSGGRPDLKEVLDIGVINRTASNRQQKRHYLGENKWSQNEEALQHAVDAYAEQASMVAQDVLQLLAKGLGSPGAFNDAFGEEALQVLRLTYYPASNNINEIKAGEIGSGTHSDYGGVTVLYADGPGLMVLCPNSTSLQVDQGTFSPEMTVPHSGEWVDVESRPGTFIVMGGEALQRLSNGLVFAAKHKVDLTGDKERHSLAFFLDPKPDAMLEPIQTFRLKNKRLYKSKLAGHKGVINNEIV